jgi:hypothetical protein
MKRSNKRERFSRRQFMQAAAGLATTMTTSSRVWGSGREGFSGKCLVTLQLDGGADVTQFCDPKVNTPGERKINNWADWADPGQVGNLLYAPVADNEWFFNRFGADMLVVNGVDAQTNSHETGRLFNWTGSNAVGKPSLSALHAAFNSPDEPLAYTVFGGESHTSGIIGYNRFDDVSRLRTLSQPRIQNWSGRPKRSEEEFDRVDTLVSDESSRLLSLSTLSPRQVQSLQRFSTARSNRDLLERLADILPAQEDMQQFSNVQVAGQTLWDNLKQQMQGALLVFKSGLGSAADISFGGFDSHDNHDPVHEYLYRHLADSVNYFWEYAEALGLADRILLVIGSDFGRTNYYNDGAGKDHWPVGSYILMEKNASWGNRVVGRTDALHFAQRIDPVTLKDSRTGVLITPAHVHKAIQEYLGLNQYAQELGFALRDTESLPLFDPTLQTGVSS